MNQKYNTIILVLMACIVFLVFDKCNNKSNTQLLNTKNIVQTILTDSHKINKVELTLVSNKEQISTTTLDRLKDENIRFKQLISTLEFQVSNSNKGVLELKLDTIYVQIENKDTILVDTSNSIYTTLVSKRYVYSDGNLSLVIPDFNKSLNLEYTYNTGPIYTTIYEKNSFFGLGKTKYYANITYSNKGQNIQVESSIIKQPKEVYLVIGPTINLGWSPIHPTQIIPTVGIGATIPFLKLKK